MFTALFSFLGGSAFRMIWGEVSAYLTAKQDHKHELERMTLQGQLDADAFARQQSAIKLQADLGIKTIAVQSEADLSRIESGAWADAVASVGRQTGIKFLDIWNGSIRPALATIAIAMICIQIAEHGFTLSEWERELFAGILGIYIADRSLAKRGK